MIPSLTPDEIKQQIEHIIRSDFEDLLGLGKLELFEDDGEGGQGTQSEVLKTSWRCHTLLLIDGQALIDLLG